MGKKNIGRKKRGMKRNNRDYHYDKTDKKHVMKDSVRRKKSAAHARIKREKQDEKEAKQKALDLESSSDEGDASVDSKPAERAAKPNNGPCCKDTEQVAEKNERMFEEWKHSSPAKIDQGHSYAYELSFWFVCKHRAHMPHFKAFLDLKNIQWFQ